MVYVFFDKERHSNGSLLIPDSPLLFRSLFLCELDIANEPFKERYCHAGGRLIARPWAHQ